MEQSGLVEWAPRRQTMHRPFTTTSTLSSTLIDWVSPLLADGTAAAVALTGGGGRRPAAGLLPRCQGRTRCAAMSGGNKISYDPTNNTSAGWTRMRPCGNCALPGSPYCRFHQNYDSGNSRRAYRALAQRARVGDGTRHGYLNSAEIANADTVNHTAAQLAALSSKPYTNHGNGNGGWYQKDADGGWGDHMPGGAGTLTRVDRWQARHPAGWAIAAPGRRPPPVGAGGNTEIQKYSFRPKRRGVSDILLVCNKRFVGEYYGTPINNNGLDPKMLDAVHRYEPSKYLTLSATLYPHTLYTYFRKGYRFVLNKPITEAQGDARWPTGQQADQNFLTTLIQHARNSVDNDNRSRLRGRNRLPKLTWPEEEILDQVQDPQATKKIQWLIACILCRWWPPTADAMEDEDQNPDEDDDSMPTIDVTLPDGDISPYGWVAMGINDDTTTLLQDYRSLLKHCALAFGHSKGNYTDLTPVDKTEMQRRRNAWTNTLGSFAVLGQSDARNGWVRGEPAEMKMMKAMGVRTQKGGLLFSTAETIQIQQKEDNPRGIGNADTTEDLDWQDNEQAMAEICGANKGLVVPNILETGNRLYRYNIVADDAWSCDDEDTCQRGFAILRTFNDPRADQYININPVQQGTSNNVPLEWYIHPDQQVNILDMASSPEDNFRDTIQDNCTFEQGVHASAAFVPLIVHAFKSLVVGQDADDAIAWNNADDRTLQPNTFTDMSTRLQQCVEVQYNEDE